MPHVVVAGAIHQSGLKLLDERTDFSYTYLNNNEDKAYIKLIQDADALVIRTQPLTYNDIKDAKNLKIISRHGVGYDSIDVSCLEKENITLTVVGDVNSQSVAEHAMTLVLAAFKRLIKCDNAVRKGSWGFRDNLEPREVANKTLLILGYGRIGTKVAKMADSFGMKVVAYDPFIDDSQWIDTPAIRVDNLETALTKADCISINMPRSDRRILGSKEFDQMKTGVVIINTARGGIVDEDALFNALKNGKVGAAGLDVFDEEPQLRESLFQKLNQVVLSPHVAGLSEEAAEAMSISSIQNVIDFFDGSLDDALIIRREDYFG